MTQSASMSMPSGGEKRRFARHKTLKGVVVSFNGGTSSFEGVMRNQSQTGARLSFCETFAIPGEFLVKVNGDLGWRPAEARWRSMTDIGVAFGRS